MLIFSLDYVFIIYIHISTNITHNIDINTNIINIYVVPSTGCGGHSHRQDAAEFLAT